MRDSDFIILDVFYNPQEADIVEGILTDNEILFQRTGDQLQFLGIGKSCDKTVIKVQREQLQQAQRLLSEFREADSVAEDFVSPPSLETEPDAKWVDPAMFGAKWTFFVLAPTLIFFWLTKIRLKLMCGNQIKVFPRPIIPTLGDAFAYLLLGIIAGALVGVFCSSITRRFRKPEQSTGE